MDIERIIKTLRAGSEMQASAWQQVQKVARQYVQMKLYGSYIDNDRCVNIGSGCDRMVAHFQEELLREVERAFLEDALMGQTLQEHLGGQL